MTAVSAAAVDVLDGPNPAMWLSDPEGDDGNAGIEQGDPVVGSSGSATVDDNGATIRVHVTGLEPGHTYTMWVVFFNDQTGCEDGCNGPDLSSEAVGGGGVLFGDGKVVGGSGTATFATRLNTGDSADAIGPSPPFAFAPYEAGEHNEFHVVIRSHGPAVAGAVDVQIHTFGGGCDSEWARRRGSRATSQSRFCRASAATCSSTCSPKRGARPPTGRRLSAGDGLASAARRWLPCYVRGHRPLQ